MKCKAVIREIEELEISAAMSAEADAHLLSCESCRAFSRERASLRLLVAGLEKVSAPPDFDWRLRARLNEAGKEQSGERRFIAGFAPGAQAIAAAACVTLLLVAVVVYRQTRSLPSGAAQSASITGANMEDRAGVEGRDKVSTPTVARIPAPAVASNNVASSVSNQPARARNTNGTRSGNARAESPRETTAQQQRIYSNDMASRGAVDATNQGNGFTSTGTAPVFPVSVPSASSSTQLRFEDGQGTRRTLAPVNFGGQELIGRRDKARLISASEKGIW